MLWNVGRRKKATPTTRFIGLSYISLRKKTTTLHHSYYKSSLREYKNISEIEFKMRFSSINDASDEFELLWNGMMKVIQLFLELSCFIVKLQDIAGGGQFGFIVHS